MWIGHHVKFAFMSQEVRNNLIIEELHKHQMVKDKYVKTPKLWGVELCWSCFSFLHGVVLSTMYEFRQIGVHDTETRWEHKGKNDSFHYPIKKNAVKSFISELQTNLGKHQSLFVLTKYID
jgi:hypothetical protein